MRSEFALPGTNLPTSAGRRVLAPFQNGISNTTVAISLDS